MSEEYAVEPVKIYENTYHLGPREGEKFGGKEKEDIKTELN